MSELSKFSSELKSWRIRKGLTQKEVADRMGISRTVLSFLENGQQAPKIQHILLLNDKWGLDLAWTITGDEEKNKVEESPAPRFGPPRDDHNELSAIYEMINAAKEVRKDLSIALKILNDMSHEFLQLSDAARKQIDQVKNILIRDQMIL